MSKSEKTVSKEDQRAAAWHDAWDPKARPADYPGKAASDRVRAARDKR